MLKVVERKPDTKIEWDGIVHEATDEMFYPATRAKYFEYAKRGVEISQEFERARGKKDSVLKTAKRKAGKDTAEKVFIKKREAIEEKYEALEVEIDALMISLYPSTKGLGWFQSKSSLPDYAINLIREYVSSKITGIPLVEKGLLYTHETAERLLFALADQRAGIMGVSRDAVLREHERSFEKK